MYQNKYYIPHILVEILSNGEPLITKETATGSMSIMVYFFSGCTINTNQYNLFTTMLIHHVSTFKKVDVIQCIETKYTF